MGTGNGAEPQHNPVTTEKRMELRGCGIETKREVNMNIVAAIIWFIGAITAALDIRQAYRMGSVAGMVAWTFISIGCIVIGLVQII